MRFGRFFLVSAQTPLASVAMENRFPLFRIMLDGIFFMGVVFSLRDSAACAAGCRIQRIKQGI
jgi:hypothetical protein